MRLIRFNLEAAQDRLHEFELITCDDNDSPPYAILSHTWMPGQEVTYHDLLLDTGREKAGNEKLYFCIYRAVEDEIEHLWMDTCCIDKSTSEELGTAVNSMFKWYAQAAVCYVYLSDVRVPSEVDTPADFPITWRHSFRRSRWFKRGWTLQELLAPATVKFYSREHKYLGSKISLEQDIHEVTNIPIAVLRGQRLSEISIEKRMQWAAKRQTSVPEDRAYCLLGIFGVHMPLIYGEGEEHALLRLQEEARKREVHLRPAEKTASPEATQASSSTKLTSLDFCEPVLHIPSKDFESILEAIPQSVQEEIADIVTANCRKAAFDFYEENALWRTKFSDEDKVSDPKLFQLADGTFPKSPDDLDLKLWIRKIQHGCSGSRLNHPDAIRAGAIRDMYLDYPYHYNGAMNIVKMTYPWGPINPLEFESSLCYAISWCRHLYAWDCEARLSALWLELHPPEQELFDATWKVDLRRTRIPDPDPKTQGKGASVDATTDRDETPR